MFKPNDSIRSVTGIKEFETLNSTDPFLSKLKSNMQHRTENKKLNVLIRLRY